VSEAIAAQAAAHGRVAIDTEFVSERHYQARLCLIQVAVPAPDTPTGVWTEVLDPIDEEKSFDPEPLARVLADPAVKVVVHAGRQDVAILRRTWSTSVTNLFDTQVAAGFLGMGNQEGYEALVRRVLGEKLRGGEGFTRWDKRPLTERQLAYAADDARCLLALGETLELQLDELGRLEWAREECRVVEESRDERTPERAYSKLPRLGRLDGGQRAVARRLVEWRDEEARRIDRPPSHLLTDQVLLELARRRPTDAAGLEQIRGLSQQTLHKRAQVLLEAIASAGEDEPPPAQPSGPRRESSDASIVSLAQALVRHRSAESGVATELIATQSELASLVAVVRRDEDGHGIRALSGWRSELVGNELRALVKGRLAISVSADGTLQTREA
jgi:ribonuclease D